MRIKTRALVKLEGGPRHDKATARISLPAARILRGSLGVSITIGKHRRIDETRRVRLEAKVICFRPPGQRHTDQSRQNSSGPPSLKHYDEERELPPDDFGSRKFPRARNFL